MKIKLKQNKTNYLIAKGIVNGKKVSFIIDTGASSSMIDKKWADKLNLKLSKSNGKAAGYGSASFDLSIIKKLEIELGDKVFKISKAMCTDLSNVNKSLKRDGAKPIVGLIGADILIKYKAIIDYDKMTMKLTA